MNSNFRLLTVALMTGLSACGDDPPAEDIFGAMGEIRPTASPDERATFARGEAIAVRRFSDADGLGPHFNVAFCGACHEKPVFGGSGARYRDFLLVGQELPDGSRAELGVNGVLAHYDLEDGRRPTDAAANAFAGRNPIPFFGVGLLAEIPEQEILRYADESDADGDGISGRPNFDRGFVGRFGRKSQTVSIEGFIRGPLFNHAGITSNPLSEARRAALPVPSAAPVSGTRSGLRDARSDGIGGVEQAQAAAPSEPIVDDDGVPDPELSEQDLFDLVSWAMLLAAPEPDAPTPESEQGRALFDAVNCSGCHVPALQGPRGPVPAYSDLLLHDMGDELADGIHMQRATGSEFRTQPLWGIVATGPYLHDGRADTLDEAIRFHGGEATGSRDAYLALSEDERGLLLEFLSSLGGRAQFTEGLLPPDYVMPEPGTTGGPISGLSPEETTRFLTGQALFDRDSFLGEGLGPTFNGDACRACHFEPTIGGAGPADVDVTRQALFVNGAYVEPEGGSMLHRHALARMRPPMNPDAQVIELRQTPSLFGMGLLEQVPEASIVAGADPEDADGDGISGRVHRLPDGRLGRFGWTALIPDMEEFARDAISNEMGLTVPRVPGRTFGVFADADDVPDPEADPSFIAGLAFYMRNLAPPSTRSDDPAAEAMGEQLFASFGCASCHTKFEVEGRPIAAYTDLLLHDVQAPGYAGVPEGDAGPREFRTAPLWGIRDTAPYWHDGRAFTLEDAIARHFTEGDAARTAYEMASAEERAALLAFLRAL